MIRLKIEGCGGGGGGGDGGVDGGEDESWAKGTRRGDDSSTGGRAGIAVAGAAPAGAAAPTGTGAPNIRLRPSLGGPAGAPGAGVKSKIRIQKQRRMGYDSEGETELDPWIEEEFVLRMRPGEDCDYLRAAVEGRQIGQGTDISITFKGRTKMSNARRAIVRVRGHLYAAKLVNLPCIVEAYKTLDRKNMFKSADICQMLLVGERIDNEDEVAVAGGPLRPAEYTYPHGITPPLRNVRKRRFRKRISNQRIESVEKEVDRLLKLDAEAQSTSYEILDRLHSRQGSVPYSEMGSPAYEGLRYPVAESPRTTERDASPDSIFGDHMEDEEDTRSFEQELEKMMQQKTTEIAADTPTAETMLNVEASESSGSDAEGGSGAGSEPEMDAVARDHIQQRSMLLEEIADIEGAIQSNQQSATKATNALLRDRFLARAAKLQSDLELKRAQIEEGLGDQGRNHKTV